MRLGLVWLYVQDVVLLQLVVGGMDDVCIIEVERYDFFCTVGILSDEFDQSTL